MIREINSQPLQEVSSYNPCFQVELRLNQTHWKFFQTENDITLEIFSLCSQLELLCKRIYCKSNTTDTCKMEFCNKFVPHACVELKKINERFSLLPHENYTFKEYMKKHGMHFIFPKLWWYMKGFDAPLESPKPHLYNYFERLSSLNQLNMMSQQIYLDLHNSVNHKYIAHQTALLYHALSDLGSYVKHYKQAVEDSFAEIKTALIVDNNQVPHLCNSEKERLDGMTRSLMEVSTSLDNDLFDPLVPVASFFL